MNGGGLPAASLSVAPGGGWASVSESGAGSSVAEEARPDRDRPTGVEGLGLAGVELSNFAFLAVNKPRRTQTMKQGTGEQRDDQKLPTAAARSRVKTSFYPRWERYHSRVHYSKNDWVIG